MPPVNYDFAAAEHLSAQLGQLIAKLEWLVWLRAGQRGSLLGSPRGEQWTGRRRMRFEDEFGREQARLKALVGQAQQVRSDVDRATQRARDAQAALIKNTPGLAGG